MHIRRYIPDDHSAALDIWLRASRVGHPFFSEAELAEQRKLVASVYLPRAENWVALDEDERLLGFIGLLKSFIGGLFVDPCVHGRGVGRALIEHAAARKGRLTVEVYEANPIAPAFYNRMGFRLVRRRPFDDDGRPQPLLVLRRDPPGQARQP